MKRLALACLVGLASAAALAATAQPAAQSATPDACFLTRDLRGHTVGVDGHTLYFDVKGRDTYQVTTSDSCLAAAITSEPIALRDLGRGQICGPLDLEVVVRGNRCVISKLTRLTPAQASALPKRLQP